ncbi:MAG TPA: envelope integrity protein Cei [Actinophytocola sp.]|uniref:envelope integrity protein Cei n=1 Tax=Actinophytocola sp. TaxID=1872138 RepID=UPI002DDCB9FD|nr:envelope integrity protein Cei [Actinophytocola sp.]HEV2784243.1 envelope integrity protein Cei [Actinophytocola sp.]
MRGRGVAVQRAHRSRGGRRRRTRRRDRATAGRPVRACFLITAVAVLAGVIWVYLLHREQVAGQTASCPGSAPASVSAAAVEPFAIVAPAGITVRVLNATDRPGLAAQVAASLQAQGFRLAAVGGNDLLHPRGSMRCVGQIRFGPGGTPAARTLSLVLPCAQLVRDGRADDTVDLALGAAFSTAHLDPSALTVLRQLQPQAAQRPDGALHAIAGPATSTVSPTLLAAARPERCG